MAKSKRDGADETARQIAGAFVARGNECAFNNLKVVTRVLTAVYDEELRPVGLRASQLALLWAIHAAEPVELSRLASITFTDQTTLSRTIATLRRSGLVGVRAGTDRRVRILSLTAAGRARFAAAMPLWESAQRRAGDWLPLAGIAGIARKVRNAARAAA
ncbi:MAG: winged helix DNA-binding protein [Betaproteobacteria bacterium]